MLDVWTSPLLPLTTADEARDLVKRFGGFVDAVLVDVHLSLPRAMADRHGSVQVLAREADTAGDDGWRTVVLQLDVLDGYRLTEGPDSYQVLCDGLQIYRTDKDMWVLDLSPSGGAHLEGGAASDQCMSGRSCSHDIVDAIE